MKQTKLEIILDELLSLFYPITCAACGNSLHRNEEILCTFCNYQLPKTNFHLDPDNILAQVFWGRVNLERVGALYFFTKTGKVQHLLHQLKYKKRKDVGCYLGRLYGSELIKSGLFDSVACIIPVPLHPDKQRKRGYNQSEVFAAGLAEAMNIPVDTASLIRTVASESQTRKSRFSRWKNVGDIFAVTDEASLRDKHVLLVDDVITTGATIEACAMRLLEVAGTRVSVAAIACAIH